MALKEKFELATGVIGLASNMGLPVDVLAGPDETLLKLAEIQADIARLQDIVIEGFQNTNTNNFYRQIQQALETSQAAHLVLSNSASSERAKEVALTDASTGLTNVVGAVDSLITSQVGVFTPGIVEDMYAALAFSLSVQINAAATYQFGEKVNGEYQHGGFLPVKSQIQAGIDAIESIKPAIAAHYFTDGFISLVQVGTRTIPSPEGRPEDTVEVPIFHTMITINHNIEDNVVARAHYLQLASEVVSQGDRDFGDDRFVVDDGRVRMVFQNENTPEISTAQGQRAQFYIKEMSLVSGDLAYFTLTGEKSDRVPSQFFDSSYIWNEPGAIDYEGLVVAAKAVIDGIHIEVEGDGNLNVQGTEGGDYIEGNTGVDFIFGNGGDDYLMDGAGNDLLFGGEGNDRYFSTIPTIETGVEGPIIVLSGQDGFIDDGAETDVDVVVFQGNFNQYTFFDDTGTTGPRIKVSRDKDPDSDVIRGIEILKFDDTSIAVSDLILLPKDGDAPDAPVINAISDDVSVVVSGTAEAKSYVTVTTNDGTAAQVQTDESGVWTLDFGSNSVFDGGDFTFTAIASDAVNNDSAESLSLTRAIDKLAPSLSVANLSTSNTNGAVARSGDTLTLGFTASETLAALPDVSLAGSAAAVTDLGGNSFRAVVTLGSSIAAGPVSLLVSMTDLAGNSGTGNATTNGGTVTIEVPVVPIPRNEIDGDSGDNILVGTSDPDLMRGFGGDDYLYGDGFELRYALSEANQVFRLYQATFNRTPDEGGHTLWTSELFTGSKSLAEVRQSFVDSEEFGNKYVGLDDAGFVKTLYINVFDRDFDDGTVSQAEIDSWTSLISDSFTRADVVNGFSESRELINKTLGEANALAVESNPAAWTDDIYRLYRATLDRDPDKGGFNGWTEQLSGGRQFEEVIAGFTNSREFTNTYGALSDPEDFVKLLYGNVLNRDFDLGEVTQAEVSGWTSLLTETFTRADIVRGFSQSREFSIATRADVKSWVRELGADDQIDGGAGTNMLAGGLLSDQFIFKQPDAAANTVLDLESWDFLSFEGFGYTSEAEVRANMTQTGNKIVFADQGTTIILERFQLTDVTDDMILV